MKIELEFDQKWLSDYKNKGDLIPAKIYFSHENESYPDDEWIDNPFVVLGWWTHTVIELLSGSPGQDFNFMEGPFCLKANEKNELLELVSEDPNVSWVVNKLELSRELVRVLNEASRVAHGEGFQGQSERLNLLANKLRNSIKSSE